MDKDEMKNKISLALKDPILQQGFEIICKNLAELEKQLEELPDKWCRNKDDYCPHLAELEKENARLKDGIALKDEEVGCVETDFNTFKSKAKDHIKRLLDCLKQDTNDPQTNYYVCQYMDKAEQFLSEVEK